MKLRDRIKDFRRVPASDLRPNPRNWRSHPQAQQDVLRGVLAEVGIADACLARELPDGSLELVDGHLRTDTMHDQEIPVLVLDVTEAEAMEILATHDPLAAMAGVDKDKLEEVLRQFSTGDEALLEMFETMKESLGSFDVSETDPPALRDGDREPFQQMTFTLHDSQAESVNEAIAKAKQYGAFDGSPNANSNGNALARIVEAYCGKS